MEATMSTNSTAKMDRVYYWTGGTERGRWNEVWDLSGKSAEVVADEVRRQGYIAVTGRSTIGPPEGPPAS
jgi:hypothetical protein